MKRIILIFSLFVISYSCKAQKNTINSSESTINGIDFLGNNVALVIQHLGQPNTIEDYFFEMDDVMSQKYNYNGLLFYIVNSKVDSFEITGNNYAFTSNNIKVGDNISILQSIYPLSFANKGTDCSGPRNLKHEGLDLKNPYGAPIYAMYDGLASIHYFEKTGYIVLIQSEIDGESISIQYFHMQNENRVTGQVSAGQIIGYQGDSGNLASGIKQGLCVSHLHIKAKNSANQAIDPRQFLTTEIDDNGNSSSSDNCN